MRQKPGAVVVLLDIVMPGLGGVELLAALGPLPVEPQVVMITGHGDRALLQQCLERGAYDFLNKPFELDQLATTVARAVERHRLLAELDRLRGSPAPPQPVPSPPPAPPTTEGDRAAMSRDQQGSLELQELIAYLDDLLEAGQGRDVCPNGLQVEGRRRVRRLVTGVSACRELFAAARERDADAVVVHHGIFWRGDPQVLTGVQYRRVAELIRGELSLLAYHLPLDRHPELGNNALACRRLGGEQLEPFGVFDGESWGFRARLPEPLAVGEMVARCQRLFGQEPLVFAHGPQRITSFAVVSGAAERAFPQAIAAGIELFVTGEASEWVMNVARESATHFVAAGHYATERLGIQALSDHLAERFGLAVEFVDIPNPV